MGRLAIGGRTEIHVQFHVCLREKWPRNGRSAWMTTKEEGERMKKRVNYTITKRGRKEGGAD